YGLRLYAHELVRPGLDESRRAEIRSAAEETVKRLRTYQTLDGGGNYLDFKVGSLHPSDPSTTLTTATVLIRFYDAQKRGVDVPQIVIDKAIKVLRRGRKADGAYIYGQYLAEMPQLGINKIKGSLGRAQVCDVALYLFHAPMTREDMARDFESLVKYQRFPDTARKLPIPHEGWYQNSGYFYFYGLFYAGLLLDQLDPEPRAKYWPQLREMVLRQQEPDGCWWDYP